MEGRAKVTKEVLCEEARFILANVMAEARYGRQNHYDDIRRVCEGAVSIPFSEYILFLDKAGYLRHDRDSESLEVTPDGEQIVNGGNLTEMTERAVAHFKKARGANRSGPNAAPDGGAAGFGVTGGGAAGSGPRALPGVAPAGVSLTPPTALPAVAPPIPHSSPASGPSLSGTGTNPALSMRRDTTAKVHTSGGKSSATVGGEIHTSSSDVLDSRYEKLANLGSGGIGTVYRARQVPLNREVALKEIRDLFGFFSEEQRHEIVRRFTEVVRAGAQLAHPNILPVHDVNLDREFPYVVNELAPNGSARRLIADAEEIPVELVLKYFIQTLHALRAAHQQKVYHRGLKPEQMLIDAFGNVKVTDFGFARIVERDAAVIRQVYVGMGNVAYMAPELYSDPSNAGPHIDIYALGIIFYELLTRRVPGRRSPMPSQVNGRLPKGIDDIFDKMTRDLREERYPTIDDILDDFDKLEGLSELLDHQTQVMVAENPLDKLKFRESAGIPETPVEGDEEDPSKRGPIHRPYSFQQRKKKI